MSAAVSARLNRLRAEEGVTLIELLVTIAILGTAFVTLVGGMTTAVIASDIHRKEATAGAAVRSYAEDVKAATYVSCATASSYAPAAVSYSAPTSFTASVTGVAYWVPSPSDPNTGSFATTCSTDRGVQRLTLQVVSADQRATELVTVLKRTG